MSDSGITKRSHVGIDTGRCDDGFVTMKRKGSIDRKDADLPSTCATHELIYRKRTVSSKLTLEWRVPSIQKTDGEF